MWGLNPMSDALTGAAITAALLATGLTLPDDKFNLTGSSDATKLFKVEVDAQGAGFTTTFNVGAQVASYSVTLPVLPSSSIFALSAAALTSGRVPYATTNGLLLDSANLTFNGTNFAHAGAGTFGTGTGAVSLNGDVTIASAKTLTLSGAFSQTGAVTFGTGTGAFTHNGSVTIVSGKTLTASDTTASSSSTTGAVIIGNGTAGGLGVGGNIGFGSSLLYSASFPALRATTSDGSDTNGFLFCGGGGSADTRGASIQVYGNESAGVGQVLIVAGNVSGGVINFKTGGTVWTSLSEAGVLAHTGLTDLSAASSGQIKFPATQNASANANTLDDYDEYTAASTACTGAISTAIVWKLTKVGNKVTLTLPAAQGAGTAINYITLGLAIPAKYRPAADFSCASAPIYDNATRRTPPGLIRIPSGTGIITLFVDPSTGTNFTVTAQCGLADSTSVSWTI